MLKAILCFLLLAETLDNAAVMKLVAAGLSQDVILLKIERSEAAFDTSTEGLIALKQAKVPDAVIRAMLLHEVPTPPAPLPAARGEGGRRPGEGPTEVCANVKQYTTGNEGYGWYPASVCVGPTVVSIDEQQLPLATLAVHCTSKALMGEDEWWLADKREIFRFRGKDEELKTLTTALARVPHGSCNDRAMRNLLPPQKP